MIVAACMVTLRLTGIRSLKEKRSIVKSLLGRMRNRFNVSVTEVDAHDNHGRAVIGIACVSGSGDYVEGQIQAVLRWIEEERPDLEILAADIELL
ncbi:MAG: DUF503 domain-containing protein [Roseiflexus castenholzii]|nr:MAG: DUF503 domain-containing protein [Roseiflexus castenholzii]